MKKLIKIIAVAAFAFMTLLTPQMAFATDPPTSSTTTTTGDDASKSGSKPVNGNAAQTASDGIEKVNPGAETDLMTQVNLILNAVYVIVGIVAVVVIILGGVTYATSQGDPAKVKKGKDTILYGVIGLVVVLMAFAITTFVLNALGGSTS